jgi:uncharacterized membrane protein
MIAAIGLSQIILWIIRIILPILVFYLAYLLFTRAFTYLGFSKLEAVIIVFVSFLFMFPIILFGFDISNIALLKYNDWILGINTGGAIIPIMISIYLYFKKNLSLKHVIIATLIVTIITFFVTEPVPSKGIISIFPYWLFPCIAACFSSIILLRKNFSKGASLAYISSTFGVLIGADFLHLPELLSYTPGKIGTMAIIGGAVLLDLIFLTGILAVLLYGAIMFKYKSNNN